MSCVHVCPIPPNRADGRGRDRGQVDKSNKMFIMFYLTKVGACGSISKLAAPELKACQYKKR